MRCGVPAVALSRVGARVVESGPGGQDLAAGAWQRLEALPDPRSPRGRIYPLACLVAIAVCAFTAAGNDRFTAVGQWIRRASQQTWPVCALRGTRSRASTGHPMRKRSGQCWTGLIRGPWPGRCSGPAHAPAGAPPGCLRSACAAIVPGAPPSRQKRWPATG
jgi:DDE_Tnp_1-associated